MFNVHEMFFIVLESLKTNAIFFEVLGLELLLILAQFIASRIDGYATKKQMEERGVRGYSFMQHGGMWASLFIISPLVAYLVQKYSFEYMQFGGLVLFVLSFWAWFILAVLVYAPASKNIPEAHVHDGHVTVAGYILIIFGTLITWVIVMAYKGLTTIPVSNNDIIITSVLLTLWAYFGQVKFSSLWCFGVQEKMSFYMLGIAIWVSAGLYLY